MVPAGRASGKPCSSFMTTPFVRRVNETVDYADQRELDWEVAIEERRSSVRGGFCVRDA
jgi:hypothetical protein